MDQRTDCRCRSGGKHCAGRTSEGAAATSKPQTICPACIQDIQRRLDELPHLVQAMKSFLGGSMKIAYESKVNATREPAAPINLHILDLTESFYEVAGYVEGRNILTLIQQPLTEYIVLGRRGDDKTIDLDGVDIALKVRAIHQKVSDVVGLAPVYQKRHAPCPECELPTLGQFIGGDQVHCSNEDCLATLTLTEYENYCIEKANE